MSETLYAVVNGDGLVENVIVADQDFIDALPDAIASEDVDTGTLSGDHRFVDVTSKDPRPAIGWTRARNGRFSPPAEPTPTAEQEAADAAAQAAADQRAEDDTFLSDALDRVRDGGSLTQDERDRIALIQLSRG